MTELKPEERNKQCESKALSFNYSPILPPALFLEEGGEIVMLCHLFRDIASFLSTSVPNLRHVSLSSSCHRRLDGG